MLIKVFKKDPFDFLILGLILVLSLLAFVQFSYDSVLKEKVVIITGIAYFFWGIFHHIKRKDLSFPIIVEYFLLALFGVVVTVFVLLRS